MLQNHSFEFFPPKTPEGAEKLRRTWRELAECAPSFFSVTFGAGGSTREGTAATVKGLCEDGLPVAPHIACIGTPRADIVAMLQRYQADGIRRIVCLRGDQPSGGGLFGSGHLSHASDLVELVRSETGDWFHIEVAAYPEFHPQSRSAQEDVAAFAGKMKAGANSAITQFFFNPDAYFRFVEDAAKHGVDRPIVPGIMPITNYMQLKGFCQRSAIDMPRWIEERLRGYGDDAASIKAFGLDVVTRLCQTLLAGGAPGLHFYTMNQAQASSQITRNLGGVRSAV